MAKSEIVLIDPKSEDVQELDRIAKEYALVKSSEDSVFSAALKQANGIARLREALSPANMAAVMSLQGSSLGFRTDKDKENGYPVNVVKEAVIEATLRGLPLVGNQFNIISGRCYVTKEGFGTLLAKIPGLRYMITTGVPKMVSAGAEAPVHIEWRLGDGEAQKKDLVFPVRVNSGMGADAINGKATRKARAWLYAQVTGMEYGDGDVEDGGQTQRPGRFAIDVTPKEETAEAAPEAQEAVGFANVEAAGLTVAQVREMYDHYKWPWLDSRIACVPPNLLAENWARYQAETGRAQA